LFCIREGQAVARAVTKQLAKVGEIFGRGDDQDLSYTSEH
jgi:hypothetical protein